MHSVEEIIAQIVIDRLGAKEEEINKDASFIEDLGADSLDAAELIMAFEDGFDIEIPDEDAEKITTVGEAVEYIKAHI